MQFAKEISRETKKKAEKRTKNPSCFSFLLKGFLQKFLKFSILRA